MDGTNGLRSARWFGGADLADRCLLPHLDAQLGRELGVLHRGGQRLARQAERHVKHQVPGLARRPRRGTVPGGDQGFRPAALEEAGAVGELAELVRDDLDLVFLPVVDPHLGDDLGHLAAVRADVLDRGRARTARDARQGL